MDEANVETSSSGSQIFYVVTGSKQAVDDACERIKERFHPWGYGTHFKAAEEIEPGKWKATGDRWSSCD